MEDPPRYAIIVVVGWLLLVAAMTMSAGADGPPVTAAGVVRLERHERTLTATGGLRNVDVDSAAVSIADAPPPGLVEEHRLPAQRAPLRGKGSLDPLLLKREVGRRLRDLELCRAKVARAAGVSWEEVEAGAIDLRWTILPSGETVDTLVLERQNTDLSLMECVHRQMNGWRFTGAPNGPVPVEYGYSFFPPIGKS